MDKVDYGDILSVITWEYRDTDITQLLSKKLTNWLVHVFMFLVPAEKPLQSILTLLFWLQLPLDKFDLRPLVI